MVAALALYPVFGVKGWRAAWIGSYTVALPSPGTGCERAHLLHGRLVG